MKYHLVYKIINLINGKIYIGKHSTDNIKDDYMGSGLLIKKAIEKYGIENFKKEIVFKAKTEKEAFKKENEIVNEEFILREDSYNLIIGGDSFEAINSDVELRKAKNRKAAISMNKINWSDDGFRERNRTRLSEMSKKYHELGIFKAPNWTGKKHKEESKRKIGEKNSQHQKGEKNSQYGTCWIKKNGENRKIKKELLNTYIEDGWEKGRIIKKQE
jgi:hypothetical protein